MKKTLKRIVSLVLCLALLVPTVSFETSAAEPQEQTFEMYEAKFTVPQFFVYEQNDNIMVLVSNPYTDEILITEYTKDLEFISQKSIISEMDSFGGFFSGKKYNYIAFGQSNCEESLEKEVFRIVKYDKEFNRISHASINGEDSQSIRPFYMGGCSFAECGNELTVHTARNWFTKKSDGLNHQGQFTIVLDTTTMTVTNKLGYFQDNHVSHSFEQFVRYDNGKRVLVDEGDAYPRSVFLQRFEGCSDYGREKYTEVNLFEMPGETGDNNTGVSVSGFEVSENNYIVAMSSIFKNDLILDYKGYSDLVLLICDKNNLSEDSVKSVYLTDHVKDKKTVSNISFVKLSENRFVVMWEERDSESYKTSEIKYVIVDENGQVINQIKTLDNTDLWQDCQAVFIDNKLVWVYPREENRNLATVASFDISADLSCNHTVVKVPEKAATCTETGNYEHYKCSECGFCFKDINATVPLSYYNVSIDCTPHHSNNPVCSKDAFVCEVCDFRFAVAKEHVPGKTETLQNLTCTDWGIEEITCKVCDELYYEYHEKTGHTFSESTVVTEATCTAEGEKYGFCTTCNKNVVEEIPVTKHTPGEWKVTQEATCDRYGNKESECIDCGKKIIETIPEKGHVADENWSSDIEPACTKWGYKTKRCTVCSKTILNEYTAPHGHKLSDWITIQIPTSEKNGEKVKICSECSWIVEREAIHKSEIPEGACKVHSPSEEWEVLIEVTCEEKGFRIRKCDGCGYAIENEFIEPEGHKKERVFTVPPSCYSYAEGYYQCTICGEIGGSFSYLYKLDHTPGVWEVSVEPTYETEGVKVRLCTVCNEVVETGTIDKLKPGQPTEPATEPVKDPTEKPAEPTSKPSGLVTNPEESTTEQILNPSEPSAQSTTKPVDTTDESSEPATELTTKPVSEPATEPVTEPTTQSTTKPVVTVPVPSVEIRTPSQSTINYGDSIIIHADTMNLPEGAYIEWSVSSGNFKIVSQSLDRGNCTVTPEANGADVITVTVYDADGEEIASDSQTMTAKAGFFQKIVAFFKKLFGLTKVIPAIFKNMF